jgi:hypothetical protein
LRNSSICVDKRAYFFSSLILSRNKLLNSSDAALFLLEFLCTFSKDRRADFSLFCSSDSNRFKLVNEIESLEGKSLKTFHYVPENKNVYLENLGLN